VTLLIEDGAGVAFDALEAEARAGFAFNLDHPRAVDFIERHTADLVTEVGTNTRLGIRAIVRRSFEEAIAPREAARFIESIIGLRSDQVGALMKLREDLAAKGVRGEALDRATARATRRMKRERALLIARTETINAANEGQIELWRQGVDAGVLELDKSFKEWIVTPDDRLCEVCRPLDSVRVGLNAFFDTARGMKSGPTAHPRCRCALSLHIDRSV
jgi:hypothetical protein